MNQEELDNYREIRENGKAGFYEQKRALIAVWGKEAVQFLNGLMTNDVAKLEDGTQMLAAFPNAQGRLLGVVRVLRKGEKLLFETEEATHEKIYNNLFRFTFAGDFFVEDLSEKFRYFEVQSAKCKVQSEGIIEFKTPFGADYFVPNDEVENFKSELRDAVEISDAVYEVLRIENGVPLYGRDMDETTIVPELGIDGLISYNKGCYIGQEIIARIHFRGHVAKQLRGLVFEDEEGGNPRVSKGVEDSEANIPENFELKTVEGKNAGKITSVAFSPKLNKTIALAFVRYDYLAEDTELKVGDSTIKVKNLPFIKY